MGTTSEHAEIFHVPAAVTMDEVSQKEVLGGQYESLST
jgi:hypothetical protein